jgi:hypothetical protein
MRLGNGYVYTPTTKVASQIMRPQTRPTYLIIVNRPCQAPPMFLGQRRRRLFARGRHQLGLEGYEVVVPSIDCPCASGR